MNPLLRPLKRWWRSRGHGVHSPFAFRFITTVLREPGVYYAYPQIESMPDAEWLKLLFRLVCEFEPSRIEAIRLTPSERQAISLADSRAEVSVGTQGGACMVMHGKCAEVMIERSITGHDSAWPRILGGMTSGMTFTNGSAGIAVIRPDLPRQDFEINF